MPVPQSKPELQRFLGMVTYLGKFIPNLSTITASLRKLLEKDVLWDFTEQHENVINKLKELVISTPILQYFDPKLPVRISCDSSKSGLGALLEQQHDKEWKPVAFASRSLTQSEQNYAMIEKECLSIVFAVTRFHEYCYSRPITVLNDHKPLKAIFSKPIVKAPPRLQRRMLRLQPYDFVLQYVPGKDMTVPDTLSRASLQDSKCEIPQEELNYHVHSVIENFPMTQHKLTEFISETSKDRTLQVVKKFVLEGWPDHSNMVPDEVKCFFTYRDEISYADGVLLKGQALIVPTSMRKDMKSRIHQGHLGIERCTARARQVLFWPRMSSEIEDMVSSCSTCQEYRHYQQKEKLEQHSVPDAPWVKVGSDLLQYNSFNYLVVVDYFSNYIELSRLPKGEAKSADVVVHMKSIFARHGIPESLVTDNGPHYDSNVFKKFSKEWEFQHLTSSPKFPQSNGMAEASVKTMKRLLKKAFKNGEDPYMAVLVHRTTPGADGKSPAEKLMNRQLRSPLPNYSLLTDKAVIKSENKWYDSKAKNLPNLNIGDTVRIHGDKSWDRKGTVLKKLPVPRSYKVETESGKVLRRNRRDLLKTKENFHPALFDTEMEYELIQDEKVCSDLNNELTHTSSQEVCDAYVTRSGRTVRKPNKFDDFVSS